MSAYQRELPGRDVVGRASVSGDDAQAVDIHPAREVLLGHGRQRDLVQTRRKTLPPFTDLVREDLLPGDVVDLDLDELDLPR